MTHCSSSSKGDALEAPASPSSSALLEFHGHLSVHNLPEGRTGDQSAKSKPLHRAIHPSRVLAETHRQLHPETFGSEGNEQSMLFSSLPPSLLKEHANDDDDKQNSKMKQATITRWTTVQVQLYKGHSDDGDDYGVSFQMNRNAGEPVENTLHRLVLSLSKKLQSKNKTKQKQQLKKHKSKNKAENLSQKRPFSIWRLKVVEDAYDGSQSKQVVLDQELPDWRNLTNLAAWQNGMAVRLENEADKNNTWNLAVEVDSPRLTAVHTFEQMEAHLFVGVPIVISAEALFADHVQVDWYTSGGDDADDESTVPSLVQKDSSCYIPTSKDVGKHLFVLLTPLRRAPGALQHDGAGCQEAYQFERAVEERPRNLLLEQRPQWTRDVTMLPKERPEDDGNRNRIRVVTYNLLADQNAMWQGGVNPLYGTYAAPEWMNKKHRFPLLLHELLSYDGAEILCLQEVDAHIYRDLLEPVLNQFDYQGLYSPKLGNNEGCALFWSLDRFERVADAELQKATHPLRNVLPESTEALERELADDDDDDGKKDWQSMRDILALLEDHTDLNQTLRQRLGHVVQIVPLRLRNNPQQLVLAANTHLFFHPMGSHIRTLQAYLVARQICKVAAQFQADRAPAVLLCGDLNSNLSRAGGALLSMGSIPSDFGNLQRHLQTFRYEQLEETEETVGCEDSEHAFPPLQLPINFVSAVAKPPAVTHIVPGFCGVLDHILLLNQPQHWVSRDSAPMPTLEDLSPSIPSLLVPSDHISLVVDLEPCEHVAAASDNK